MPEQLTHKEVSSQTDPSVAKQYDDSTPKSQQFTELYKITDGLNTCLLTTKRKDIGDLPVSRSMAVSKRIGPDFLFIANKHSKKFEDLGNDRHAQITFQDSKTQDWVSISGKVTTISNDDPRIKELYNTSLKAWFGDLGDGVHNGTADDPRMTLIEFTSKYIAYWKTEVGSLGFVKEIAQATFQGKVAQVGALRQLFDADIQHERNN